MDEQLTPTPMSPTARQGLSPPQDPHEAHDGE